MFTDILRNILATILVLCCGQYFLFAQSDGFTKTYFLDQRSTLFYAVRQFGDDVVVLGQFGRDSTGKQGVFMARIDTFGQIIKLKAFQDPLAMNNLDLAYFSCEAVIPTTTGNGFVFSGGTRGSKNLFMIKVDSTLEMEFYKEHEGLLHAKFANFMISFQEAYYTIGIVQNLELDFNIFIQKVDINGNLLWEKTYGSIPFWGNSASAVVDSNGIIILSSKVYDPNHFEFNDEQRWTEIFKIDTSGLIQWKWISEMNEEGAGPEGFIKIRQDYYYTTHPPNQVSSQTIHYAPQIVCRDSLFNLKWKRTYGDTLFLNWFSTLTKGPDSFLYAAGYIPDGVTWGRVCKIDPENGELVWEARDTAFYIPGWGSRNRLEGITVLPSGSVIAVGYTIDYTNHENGILYKVTADGCIDTLCTTVGIDKLIQNQEKKINLYPNPAIDEITFDIGDFNDLFVDFFNMQGIIIYNQALSSQKNIIPIDKIIFLPGLYFWRAVNKKGEIIESGKIIIEQ